MTINITILVLRKHGKSKKHGNPTSVNSGIRNSSFRSFFLPRITAYPCFCCPISDLRKSTLKEKREALFVLEDMTSGILESLRPVKRIKTQHENSNDECETESSNLSTLGRSITPPTLRQQRKDHITSTFKTHEEISTFKFKAVSSPYKLTHIRDLSNSSGNNEDTIKLRDILGDPLIKECWQFNYLFDVDFLMDQFDQDVKKLVKVKVVHGSWRRETPNRIRIDVSALAAVLEQMQDKKRMKTN